MHAAATGRMSGCRLQRVAFLQNCCGEGGTKCTEGPADPSLIALALRLHPQGEAQKQPDLSPQP